MIYLIGSLRNETIPSLAQRLREEGHEVFDDWHCPGPNTDDYWQTYETFRGRSYQEALDAPHAWNVFRYDKQHLDRADTVVLVAPAGRSAHLEFGYSIGMGKRGFILLDKEPERWDVMYRFATGVCIGFKELSNALRS